MSVTHCIFAQPDRDVWSLLASDPRLAGELYRFEQLEGVTISSSGLLVARLPELAPVHATDGVAAPAPGDPEERIASVATPPARPASDEPSAADAWRAGDLPGLMSTAALLRRYPWLATVLPPPDLLATLAAAATRAGVAAAWYYAWECGDDLYAEAAWLFGPDASEVPWSPKRRPEAQRVLVRETALAWKPGCHCYRSEINGASRPWRGSPFRKAMQHLCNVAELEYFAPGDPSDFDWDKHRSH